MVVLPFTVLYNYTLLPYEVSHGIVFMVIKWIITVVAGLFLGIGILGTLMHWYDDAKSRTQMKRDKTWE